MRKDFLFKYLHDKKVPIEGSADKSNVVKKVLEIWGSTDEVEMFIDPHLPLYKIYNFGLFVVVVHVLIDCIKIFLFFFRRPPPANFLGAGHPMNLFHYYISTFDFI